MGNEWSIKWIRIKIFALMQTQVLHSLSARFRLMIFCIECICLLQLTCHSFGKTLPEANATKQLF